MDDILGHEGTETQEMVEQRRIGVRIMMMPEGRPRAGPGNKAGLLLGNRWLVVSSG